VVDFNKLEEHMRERDRWRAERPGCAVFTGSREWSAVAPVRAMLTRLHAAGYGRVVHGAARGLDAVVDVEARKLWLAEAIGRHPADWSQGRAAGIRRNEHMLRKEEPHLVVAAPLPGSVGTWHCAAYAAGECPVLVFLGGLRPAIEAFAVECDIDPRDRARAVTCYVDEMVRQQVARSRGVLSMHWSTMPDPRKAWALLSPSGEWDARGRAGYDALVGAGEG
jgi:hypothetical protein